jgi:hypothetical protein
MIPLVPPDSGLLAAVAVEVVMAAPEVTSKDMRHPVFVPQFTGAAVLARAVTLKKIKSVPAG